MGLSNVNIERHCQLLIEVIQQAGPLTGDLMIMQKKIIESLAAVP